MKWVNRGWNKNTTAYFKSEKAIVFFFQIHNWEIPFGITDRNHFSRIIFKRFNGCDSPRERAQNTHGLLRWNPEQEGSSKHSNKHLIRRRAIQAADAFVGKTTRWIQKWKHRTIASLNKTVAWEEENKKSFSKMEAVLTKHTFWYIPRGDISLHIATVHNLILGVIADSAAH